MKKVLNSVEPDHFKHYKYPVRIEASEGGALAYTLAEADVEKNSYPSRLFVIGAGDHEAANVMDASGLTGFFWRGEKLFMYGFAGEEDKGRRVSTVSAYDYIDNSLTSLFTVGKIIDYAACLSEGKWLFVCKDSIADGGGPESGYIAAEEYPLRLDGEGYVSGIRRRAYIFESGAAALITPENMNIGRLKAYEDEYAVFYGNEHGGFLGDETSSLYRLDLKTFETTPVGVGRYVYSDILALTLEEIMAVRNARDVYGDSQDCYVDRISLKDGSFERLNGDCSYHLTAGVYTDIMYGAAEKALGAVARDALFIATVRDRTNIFVGDFESKEIVAVTSGDMVIADFRVSGAAIYMIAAPCLGGPEIWKIPVSGGIIAKITDFNGWMDGRYALSKPEGFTFTVKDGSCDMTGYVMKPVDFDESRKYAAILYIHGGPNSAYGPNYYHETQLMASLGYGVMYCNPRGSIGYGAKFADLRGQYYEADFDGIMEFLDEAVSRNGWIDQGRLAVAGGSYGGMMTNWAITHSDRFKSAVSDCCCVNEIADFFLSDIGFSFASDAYQAALWDEGAAGKMWDKSPIKHAPDAKTPTLFIHGGDDFRCSAEQSLQMMTALKYHGVEARTVIMKGEKHSLAFDGKPAGRIRRFEEIIKWHDRFLRVAPNE